LHETLGFGLDIAPISMLAIEVFQEFLLYVFQNVPSILLKLRIHLQSFLLTFSIWTENQQKVTV